MSEANCWPKDALSAERQHARASEPGPKVYIRPSLFQASPWPELYDPHKVPAHDPAKLKDPLGPGSIFRAGTIFELDWGNQANLPLFGTLEACGLAKSKRTKPHTFSKPFAALLALTTLDSQKGAVKSPSFGRFVHTSLTRRAGKGIALIAEVPPGFAPPWPPWPGETDVRSASAGKDHGWLAFF